MESSKEADWTWPGNYKLHLEDGAFIADSRFSVRRWKPVHDYKHVENCSEYA